MIKNTFTTPDGDTLNLVTCGQCGLVFAHLTEHDADLTCPYCSMTSDLCDFPDLYIDNN